MPTAGGIHWGMETNESTAAEITAAQIEADRYADYLEMKADCAELDRRTDRAMEQFFALGETQGDLEYWQHCARIGDAARARLRAMAC